MADAALSYFDSLEKWEDLEGLIEQGELEGLHVECKTSAVPRLNKDQKKKLAKSLSGFANTAGGVLIWGMATTRGTHTGEDVMNQIEPIGACAGFRRQVESAIPGLTTPPLMDCQHKIILKQPQDTRGVLLTHIPYHGEKPIQSSEDERFYMRSGGGFVPLPYVMIERMFAATEVPEVTVGVVENLVERRADNVWRIPFWIGNASAATAEHVDVNVEVLNGDAFAEVTGDHLVDESPFNPGRCVFSSESMRVLHPDKRQVFGRLVVKTLQQEGATPVVELAIAAFACRMQVRQWKISIHLMADGKVKVETNEKTRH